MLDNLKIAVRRQQKLILIFIVTVFLPAIFLSIFGIFAIRNERFRREEQIEAEQRHAAALVKELVGKSIREIESRLLELASQPVLFEPDREEAAEALHQKLSGQAAVNEVFLVFRDGEAFFPELQLRLPPPRTESSPAGRGGKSGSWKISYRTRSGRNELVRLRNQGIWHPKNKLLSFGMDSGSPRFPDSISHCQR